MRIEAWGWDDRWAGLLARPDDLRRVARVVGQDRDRWSVQSSAGGGIARLPSAKRIDPYPVVGDWVLIDPGPSESDPCSLHSVLARRSAFVRAAPLTGATEQVLAANVDLAWIVHGLDRPLNARALERFLAVAWESGATPELVLTKADLAADEEAAVADARRVAIGVTVHLVSATDPERVASLRTTIPPGATVALLGPSGAGKSTLVNALSEATIAATGAVRSGDHKGRHTTVRRQLYQIPGGALLLDTPGIRELRVWDLDEGLPQTFPEIDALAGDCRFRDCTHRAEPGCAVQAAVADGRLDPARLESLHKLKAEADYQRRKTDPLARAAALSEYKAIMGSLKRHHPKYNRD